MGGGKTFFMERFFEQALQQPPCGAHGKFQTMIEAQRSEPMSRSSTREFELIFPVLVVKNRALQELP